MTLPAMAVSAAATPPAITDAQPTVFFTRVGDRLFQQATVTFDQAPAEAVTVTVTVNGATATTTVPAGSSTTASVNVPDITTPGAAAFAVAGGTTFTRDWRPQRKWTVWMQPSFHVDLYSTSNATWTPEEHSHAIDTALDLLDRYPDYRFQLENGLPVEEYKANRPDAQWQRLVQALRSGRMAVGAQYTGMHPDEASDESIVQGQYAYSGLQDLYRSIGVQPDAGISYDVPGTGLATPALLAASNIKYALWAPNHSYALYERMHLPWLFSWKAPDGSSVLTWRAAWNYGYEKNQYYQLQGTDWPTRERVMNQMLLDRQNGVYHDPYGTAFTNLVPAYNLSDLLLIWDYGDNTAADPEPIDIAHQWNQRYAYPQMKFGTTADFMDHVGTADNLAQIPEIGPGHSADAWTYVVGAQGLINEWTRRAHRDLPAAATWCSLSTLLGGASCDTPTFHDAWQDVGKVEAHDWFYGSYPTDIIVKQQTGQTVAPTGLPLPFNMDKGRVPSFMAPDLDKAAWGRGAGSAAESLLSSSSTGFASLLQSDGGEVAVLNNGTEDRSDLVAIAATTKHVVDEASGTEVPTQTITAAEWASGWGARPVMALYANDDAQAQSTADVTVFVARHVPGLGYRRYRLSDTPGKADPTPPPADPAYTLGFDPVTGALASIVDTRTGRQLVDQSAPWKLGELLVGEPAADAGDIFDTPQPIKNAAQTAAAQSMKVVLGGFPGAAAPTQCGAVLCQTHVAGSAADEPRAMTVYTYRELDRVDVALTTSLSKAKVERVSAAFPLAGSSDAIRYSVPFGVHHVGENDFAVQPMTQRMLADWLEVGDSKGQATAVTSPDFAPFMLGDPKGNLMDDLASPVPAHPWYFPTVIDTDAGSAVDIGTYVAHFSLAAGHPGVGQKLAASSREPLQAVALAAHTGPLADAAASLVHVAGGRVTAVKPRLDGQPGLVVRVVADGGPLTVEPDRALALGPPSKATLQERPLGLPVGTTIDAAANEIVTLVFPPLPAGAVQPAVGAAAEPAAGGAGAGAAAAASPVRSAAPPSTRLAAHHRRPPSGPAALAALALALVAIGAAARRRRVV